MFECTVLSGDGHVLSFKYRAAVDHSPEGILHCTAVLKSQLRHAIIKQHEKLPTGKCTKSAA